MSQKTPPIAKMTHFIQMRDITVPIFILDGIEYVPARDLVDYAGINWRSALSTIFTEENIILYGTCRLMVALYEPNRRASTTDMQLETAKNLNVCELVCFKLSQAYMYLAKINVSHMKAKGNIDGAKRLLAIQSEWANAIHDYETHGVAINKTAFENTKHLKNLYDIYQKATDSQQRQIIAKQIDYALGVQRDINPTNDLFSETI